MAKKKNCPFCGADYKDTLPACPYCGTTNYKGAEAQYFEKLENVRTNMEDLGNVPEQETKRQFKLGLLFVAGIFGVFAVIGIVIAIFYWWISYEPDKDPQAEYLWKQANYPIMDELYEQGEYDELLVMYRQAVDEDQPVYDWEHECFCDVLDDALYLQKVLELLADGQELDDFFYEDLVYYGWKFDGPYIETHLSEEEIAIVMPYVEEYLEDFYSRWEFTDKERAAFIKDRDESYGYPDYDLCEDYIKKWKKEQRKK